MAKITKVDKDTRKEIKVKTLPDSKKGGPARWWLASNKADRASELISTASYLKDNQSFKFRAATLYARLYGNTPLFNVAGASSRLSGDKSLPLDRPTFNVVQSCVDTLTARLTQSRPRPVFLTDNGDYKRRSLAKQMDTFINGELYQTKAYQLGEFLLRDAEILGTGALKVFEADKKVALERVLITELFVDYNDALYGQPRCLYQFKLVDREVLAESFPDAANTINLATQAFTDSSSESTNTTSDQVIVVEGWRLPSGEGSNDGKHIIACSSGSIVDEQYDSDSFPFVFLHYSPRLLGFWGQGLAEQLMGTQIEINKLLITISKSINLVGVPRVFVEEGSKVVKSHLDNQVGAIVTYRGIKPSYETAPCVPQEIYSQLQRLIDYSYQQSGISALAAASAKPAGLDSGAALREYDDLQSDRFAAIAKRYDNVFIDLAYKIIYKAAEIAERDGSYQTVFPNKDGTRQIDLPDAALLKDPFIIQCYDSSSLPRDPAGRLSKVQEMMQAGIIDPAEGRRLLDFPDLSQDDKLSTAGEERILQVLDRIVEEGIYTPPDPFMDLILAQRKAIQYYNLYVAANLEEEKAEMLRTFISQITDLQTPPAPPMQPVATSPTGVPAAPPVSDLLPNVPQ